MALFDRSPPNDELRYVVLEPSLTPPGGWCYRESKTGKEWERRDSIALLCDEVAEHRKHNEMEPGDPWGDVMHYTGATLVDRGLTTQVQVQQKVHRTVSDYWYGIKSYVKIRQMEQDGKPVFVSQQEAEKRASICWRCPKNVVDQKVGKVKKMTNAEMRRMVGDRTTAIDNKLHTCAVCSCENRVLVHLVAEVIKEQKIDSRYPYFCWKHKVL